MEGLNSLFTSLIIFAFSIANILIFLLNARQHITQTETQFNLIKTVIRLIPTQSLLYYINTPPTQIGEFHLKKYLELFGEVNLKYQVFVVTLLKFLAVIDIKKIIFNSTVGLFLDSRPLNHLVSHV